MTANSVVIGSHTDYQESLFAVSVTNNCRKRAVSMTTINRDQSSIYDININNKFLITYKLPLNVSKIKNINNKNTK